MGNPDYYIYRTPLSIFIKTIPFHRAFDHSVLNLFRMYGASGTSLLRRKFFFAPQALMIVKK
jgi:ABC-type nitrate/sulfonate/bicarbonate transport system permease component